MIIAYQDKEAAKAISENIGEEYSLVLVYCTNTQQAENINHLVNEYVTPEVWKIRTRTYLHHLNGSRVMLQSGSSAREARGLRPTCEIDARFD